MNSFGRLFRVHIFGESHGTNLGVIIDGVPSGLSIKPSDFKKDLQRRNPKLKGTTSRKECDSPRIVSGVFKSKTTGAPLTIIFDNKDVDSSKYKAIKDKPRPGHADFTANIKYGGFNDYRGAAHFSGRMTLALVASGVIAKKLLKGIDIKSRLLSAGDPNLSVEENINRAIKNKDSIGGVVDCTVKGLKPGLGEPFFDSIDALIAHIALSIPGVKGIEFGAGFDSSSMSGSSYNDSIVRLDGKTLTNNSGGINGGLSNSNPLYFKIAVKPTPSIALKQSTINIKTGKPAKLKVEGRHDVCFALRIPVVLEAAVSIVLSDLMLLEQKIKRISV